MLRKSCLFISKRDRDFFFLPHTTRSTVDFNFFINIILRTSPTHIVRLRKSIFCETSPVLYCMDQESAMLYNM